MKKGRISCFMLHNTPLSIISFCFADNCSVLSTISLVVKERSFVRTGIGKLFEVAYRFILQGHERGHIIANSTLYKIVKKDQWGLRR